MLWTEDWLDPMIGPLVSETPPSLSAISMSVVMIAGI